MSDQSIPPPLPGTNCPQPAKSGPWGFWATAGFGLLCMIAVTIGSGIGLGIMIGVLTGMGEKPPVSEEEIMLDVRLLSASMFAAVPFYIGTALLFAWLKRPGPGIKDYFSLRNPGPKSWLIWTLAGIAASLGITFLIDLLGAPDENWVTEIWNKGGSNPFFLFSILIIAPFVEEWLFRGFLFRGWESSAIGPVGAILLTSLTWTVIHNQYDWYGLTYLFLIGLVFGWARWKTQSIWIPMWMHFINNLASTIMVALSTTA